MEAVPIEPDPWEHRQPVHRSDPLQYPSKSEIESTNAARLAEAVEREDREQMTVQAGGLWTTLPRRVAVHLAANLPTLSARPVLS